MADALRLRLLFVKESQNWPRSSGHDVHGFQMMAALAARGHSVSLATLKPPTPEAIAGLPLAGLYPLAGPPEGGRLPLSSWQRKFASYYGVEDSWGAGLARALRAEAFDAVISYSKAHTVNNRIAAYMLAVDRVASTTKLRGMYA